MNISKISTFLKKTLALFLVAYFSLLSPVTALALTQPVSVPVSVPVTPPAPTPVPSPSPKPTPSPVPSPTPAPKAFISVNNTSVVSGANLNISWNVPSASATDYIRVLTLDNKIAGPMGISPSNNCNLNNVSGSAAIKSGSCVFTSAVISDLGTFKLAYYNNSGSLIATSNTFKVLPASSGTLTITSGNIGIGQSVNLNWATIANAHPKDYINYLNTDNYTGTAAGHTYWPSNNCKWFTDSTTAKQSGSCSIESPYLSGNYKLVLRSGNVPVGQPAPILAVSNVINVSTISAPKPDLSIEIKPTVENSTIGVGTSASNSFAKITLTTTVKNIGSSSAQPSVTQINTNNVNEYWRLSTNSLAPGASQVLTVTTYKAPGDYQFKATADADRQITESNEDNNTAMASVKIEAPKPDLTVVNLVPGSFKVGEKGEFKVTVKNIGQADAIIKNDNFYLAFVLKKDGSKYGIALTSYFGQMQTLKAGETKTFTTQTYYKLTQAGKYTFSSDIDALKQINESNENNNKAISSFTVTAGQPTISSLYTYSLSWGGYFIIYGKDLGKSGKINLYNTNSSVPFYNANILSWSDTLIVGQISPKVGGNKTYGFQVSTQDNRQSSIIYRYISK